MLFAVLVSLLLCTIPLAAQESDESRGTPVEPAAAAELREQIALGESLLGKTPDRGAVLYFLATAHAQLHEILPALTQLKECIALKEGFDPAGDPAFTGLRGSPDFDKLIEQAHRDFPSVAQSRLAFTTIEKDLVPEGLAYDPQRDAFYLGSLFRRKIVLIPNHGKISDFVPAGRDNLLPILGIRIDPRDATVWSNSFTDDGKTELLHFDRDGLLLGRFSAPPGKHGFNDLVVLRSGDIFLTDTTGNLLFRFDSTSKQFATVKLSRELLQPNGIALTNDESAVYVADDLGILRLDVQTGESLEVDPGPHSTLAGADGLYWHKGSLIAIQNGIGSPRIAAFLLTKDGHRVASTTILENRSTFTVLPTTGAIRGDDFYFIVNSQLDNLNGTHVLDPTKLQPVRIAILHLP